MRNGVLSRAVSRTVRWQGHSWHSPAPLRALTPPQQTAFSRNAANAAALAVARAPSLAQSLSPAPFSPTSFSPSLFQARSFASSSFRGPCMSSMQATAGRASYGTKKTKPKKKDDTRAHKASSSASRSAGSAGAGSSTEGTGGTNGDGATNENGDNNGAKTDTSSETQGNSNRDSANSDGDSHKNNENFNDGEPNPGENDNRSPEEKEFEEKLQKTVRNIGIWVGAIGMAVFILRFFVPRVGPAAIFGGALFIGGFVHITQGLWWPLAVGPVGFLGWKGLEAFERYRERRLADRVYERLVSGDMVDKSCRVEDFFEKKRYETNRYVLKMKHRNRTHEGVVVKVKRTNFFSKWEIEEIVCS